MTASSFSGTSLTEAAEKGPECECRVGRQAGNLQRGTRAPMLCICCPRLTNTACLSTLHASSILDYNTSSPAQGPVAAALARRQPS